MTKVQIMDKIREIAQLPEAQARAYDTAMTWAFFRACYKD